MLADIDDVAKKMRNTLAASSLAPNLMIWGIVWAIAFTGTYFRGQHGGWIWLVACMMGLLASAVVGFSQHKQRVVLSQSEKQLGKKMVVFWLSVFAYASLMVFVLKPTYGPDFVTIFVLFTMLAYVVMGLWLSSLPLALVGAFITLVTVFGRFALSEPHFLLWMAAFGGGGLFVPGLYIHWRWR